MFGFLRLFFNRGCSVNLLLRILYFLEQVKGIGIIGTDEALNWVLSGPLLRPFEIERDLHKVTHYESYE